MYTNGIDLIEISRIKKSAQRPEFLKKVYSDEELDFIMRKKNPYPSLAGNWAAKEAFSKALGTGVRSFELYEVSVLRDELGKPYLKLSGKAKEIAFGISFSVSITHTGSLACASVIAFKEQLK